MASNDPRDYILKAGQSIGAGIDHLRAREEREKLLNTPLPQFAQQQFNPPVPTNPVSIGDVAGMAGTGAGSQLGGLGSIGANPGGTSVGRNIATGMPDTGMEGRNEPMSIGQEHPEVEKMAQAYARGEMDIESALSKAKQYTYRDMEGLELGLKAREQGINAQRSSDSLKREEEITKRVTHVTGLKGEQATKLEEQKQGGRIDLEGLRGKNRIAEAHIKADAAVRAAELRAKALLQAAEARQAAGPDPELKLLELDLKRAKIRLDAANKALSSNAALVDDAVMARAMEEFSQAQTAMDSADKSISSYLQARAGQAGPAQQPPAAQPQPGVQGGGAAVPIPGMNGAPGPTVMEPTPGQGGINTPYSGVTKQGREVNHPGAVVPPGAGGPAPVPGMPPPAAAPPPVTTNNIGMTNVRRKRDGVVKQISTARAIQMVQTGEFELVR